MYDKTERIVFDPTGGGSYEEGGVQNGGHKWFPSYENVKEILDRTLFSNINFLCYHTEDGQLIKNILIFLWAM